MENVVVSLFVVAGAVALARPHARGPAVTAAELRRQMDADPESVPGIAATRAFNRYRVRVDKLSDDALVATVGGLVSALSLAEAAGRGSYRQWQWFDRQLCRVWAREFGEWPRGDR